MTDCIFCKIVAKEIPASIAYEDDVVLAFLDITPTNKGHVLIVPKEHARNVFDTPKETLEKMVIVAQNIARGMQDALGAEGATLVMNNEPAGGQEVFHTHLHVIPRFTNDGIFQKAKRSEYANGEMDETAEKIKAALT
ncbi:HIT family protein [Candidatus Parcubacteria bacterium]|uniref:HIT family protein n=1 Tax=Candidatus Kaiserbacteria bacterium CG10_big_fil_rev_8_21_14_0_10_47_16 TaxID=1974608 RepID=A0A2H0UDQ2_9BACT|nr:HIT family protein [Candidatus Parcubacteria bacterium]PIR84558.1 MAG: HIT family protein [Candidatus Kaiserbacteria bacterium CG10_big_fil_rev_8_21_14_0_10_47_16]